MFLTSATVAAYWPVLNCGFVDLDDPDNVTMNPQGDALGDHHL